MVIKNIGANLPTPATEATSGVAKPSGAGFANVAGTQASPTDGVQSAAKPPVVDQAVADVATEIRAGKLPSTEARVDAVIARIVSLQSGDAMPARQLRARVEEAQMALGDHPAFAGQVTAMLDKVLATPDA